LTVYSLSKTGVMGMLDSVHFNTLTEHDRQTGNTDIPIYLLTLLMHS